MGFHYVKEYTLWDSTIYGHFSLVEIVKIVFINCWNYIIGIRN